MIIPSFRQRKKLFPVLYKGKKIPFLDLEKKKKKKVPVLEKEKIIPSFRLRKKFPSFRLKKSQFWTKKEIIPSF